MLNSHIFKLSFIVLVPYKRKKVEMTANNITKISDSAAEYWALRKSLLEKEHELKVQYLQEKRMWVEKYYS